jgi:putative MFS transporter
MLAAILGDLLDFFDYYLIGFVLAFIVGPWKLNQRSSLAGMAVPGML